MASTKNFVIIIAIVAVCYPCISAKEFIVGDEKGWALNFDGDAWTQGKQFYVGDKLVFNFEAGKHNVLRVDGNGFKTCTAPPSATALTSGSEVITLATPGKKWYICGVSNHCETGNMKLLIDVLPATESPTSAPPPSPNQDSSATGISPFLFSTTVAIFGVLMKLVL